MTANLVLEGYQARLHDIHGVLAQHRYCQAIALTVLVIALAVLFIAGFLAMVKHSVPLWATVLPVPVVAYCYREHSRRNADTRRLLRLKRLYEAGIERIRGEWAGKGRSGEAYGRPDHPYDADLNVIGEGSLFELLCTSRTEAGRECLAEYLLVQPSIEEARKRQEAVQELQRCLELREKISELGRFESQEIKPELFGPWLDLPIRTVSAWSRGFLLVSSTCLATVALLGFAHAFPLVTLAIWTLPLIAFHSAIGFSFRSEVLALQKKTTVLAAELDLLEGGLALLRSQHFKSSRLQELVEVVSNGKTSETVGQLRRLVNAFLDRDKEWFYAISRVLLTGTQLFLAIEVWRKKHGKFLLQWLAAWGEFEALLALACYAYEHPENSFPVLLDSDVAIEAERLRHPLLPYEQCSPNDIELNQTTRFYVISGSNMAGKSTLLRTLGLNALLAYAGAPICGTSMRISAFTLHTSLAVNDSLPEGKSKFQAEMDRLQRMLKAVAESAPVLFVIDELLSGTNSRDRRMAGEAIVRTLMARGAVGVLSTHDLSLAEIADAPGLAGITMHMGSRDGSDPMDFDYVLKPGVTQESSALAIARLAGVPL